jgi:hypothetical protein
MSKETRRKWQKMKLATDEIYKGNQKDAQERWRESHKDYSRNYRDAHPEYAEENRKKQINRNAKRKMLLNLPDFVKSEIAKMDVSKSKKVIISGYYRLIPLLPGKIAKMDQFIAKIDIITIC